MSSWTLKKKIMPHFMTLQECFNLSDVVDVINDGGSSEAEPHELAANYAYEAAYEGCRMNFTLEEFDAMSDEDWELEVQAHFEALEEAGAKFDWEKTIEYMLNFEDWVPEEDWKWDWDGR